MKPDELTQLPSSTAAFRPLRWVDDAQLRHTHAQLLAQLSEWTGQWGVAAQSVEVCQAHACEARAKDLSWHALIIGEGEAWLGCQREPADALARALFGSSGTHSHDARSNDFAEHAALSSSVTQDGLADLYRRLQAALGLASLHPDPSIGPQGCMPNSDAFRAWSGFIAIQWSMGKSDADASSWCLLVPASAFVVAEASGTTVRNPPQIGALTPLTDVLAHRELSVKACLDDLEMTLGELLSLRPGNVLMTTHSLTRPLQVELAGGSPLFGATLCQSTEMMAIALQPLNGAPQQ